MQESNPCAFSYMFTRPKGYSVISNAGLTSPLNVKYLAERRRNQINDPAYSLDLSLVLSFYGDQTGFPQSDNLSYPAPNLLWYRAEKREDISNINEDVWHVAVGSDVHRNPYLP